jgi:transcriptional activator of cad operon
MSFSSSSPFRVGAWRVDPTFGQMQRDGEAVRIEARTLRLLVCLAEHAGAVVSIDQLLDQVWSGVIVTPDSVYQAIASLRRLLGDDPKQPAYIVTVPRLGYRLIANVGPWTTEASSAAGGGLALRPAGAAEGVPDGRSFLLRESPRRRGLLVGLAALAVVAVIATVLYQKHGAAAPHRTSVGVLPFLDLTSESMDQEYFADGMTEELIDKLSKIPDLRVPSPTASFYLKGKKMAVAAIAQYLGVAYLLDGSVRQSDVTLRVAVRLVRARDGYVIWSNTYDRPLADKLKVQDDIAAEVAEALTRSIESAGP